MLAAVVALMASAVFVPKADELAFTVWDKIRHRVQRENAFFAATYNLWVDPSGNIVGCSIGNTAGKRTVAELVCPLLVLEHIDKPKDASGKPTYARVNFSMSGFSREREWRNSVALEEWLAMPNITDPNAILVVPSAGIYKHNDRWITLEIGPDGDALRCDNPLALSKKLFSSVCALAKAASYDVYRSENGNAVSYVRTVRLVSDERH